MGRGDWDESSFASYSSMTKGAVLDSLGRLTGSGVSSNQDIYKHDRYTQICSRKTLCVNAVTQKNIRTRFQ